MPDNIVWLLERAGALLLIAALGTCMGTLLTRFRGSRAIAASLLVILSLIPIGNVSGFIFIYSVVGPLSTATIIGCIYLMGLMLGFLPPPSRYSMLMVTGLLAVLGLVLYPGAIGLLPWDPYRMGFGGAVLPAVLAVVALAAGAANLIFVSLWIAASAAGWQLELFVSKNLWDYVIDPLAWLASLLVFATAAIRGILQRRYAE